MSIFDDPNRFLEDQTLLIPGHFVGAEGGHLDRYFNKKALSVIPRRVTAFCLHINDHFFRRADFNAVAGPELGAVIPSFEVARLLEFYTNRDIRHITVEKKGAGKEFEITSGLDVFAKGRSFVLLEDVLTSGGSFIRARQAIERAGGTVVYAAALLNRGRKTAHDLGVKELYSVLDLELPSWTAESCPLCRNGTPINTTFGRGKEYVAKHGQPDTP